MFIRLSLFQTKSYKLILIDWIKQQKLDFSKGTVKVLWFYFVFQQYKHKMTQYNTLNGKLTNPQLIKLKSGIKNVTLNL